MTAPDWYAPPPSPPGPHDAPLEGERETAKYARIGIRIVGRIIDALAEYAMAFAGLFVVGVFEGMSGRHLAPEGAFAAFVSQTFLALAYEVIAEWTAGATLGKAVLGLRVRSSDLAPCTLRGAIVRNIGYYVDGLFFGAIAYGSMSKSPQQQRLGDKWGRTVVIYGASVRPRATPMSVVAGVIVGCAAAAGGRVLITAWEALAGWR